MTIFDISSYDLLHSVCQALSICHLTLDSFSQGWLKRLLFELWFLCTLWESGACSWLLTLLAFFGNAFTLLLIFGWPGQITKVQTRLKFRWSSRLHLVDLVWASLQTLERCRCYRINDLIKETLWFLLRCLLGFLRILCIIVQSDWHGNFFNIALIVQFLLCRRRLFFFTLLFWFRIDWGLGFNTWGNRSHFNNLKVIAIYAFNGWLLICHRNIV